MLERLAQYLDEDKATCYRYLLINPLKRVKDTEPLALVNIKDTVIETDIAAIARPDLTLDIDNCPHLIMLAAPNQTVEYELLKMTVDRRLREQNSYKHYICAWISSELAINPLAKQLCRIGEYWARLTQADNVRFFPFYEPVPLQLLNESAQGIFPEFSCMHKYLSINYYGELIDLAPTKQLTTEQRDAAHFLLQHKSYNLRHLKLTYQLTELWHKQVGELPDYALTIATRQIVNAKHIGLENNADILSYSFFALLSEVQFYQHKEIKQAVELTKANPDSLMQQFKAIDAQVWHDLGIKVIHSFNES